MTTTLPTTARLTYRLSPERLRRTLERLGPGFIKIGQYLALRPDVLDEAYCNELLKLVDRVPPASFNEFRDILIKDLGGSLNDHFEWVSSQPIGSGSLAQVYHARTVDGDEVALKIQRPDIIQRSQRDLRRLRWLARLADRTGALPGVRAVEVVAEVERWMAEELDGEHELSNLILMHSYGRDSALMVVPRPYPELCGQRVITTEYFSGVPFSLLLRYARAGNWQEISRLGFDRDLLAKALVEAMLEQIFRWGVFHADVHPGNVIALTGNRIGFIDFGLVEALEPRLKDSLPRYVRAVYVNDTDEMLRALAEVLISDYGGDAAAFRQDFLERNRLWQRERLDIRRRGSPLARYMIGVLQAAKRHDMRLPAGLLAIYRSLLTAEMVATELTTNVDLGSVGRQFFRRLELEQLLRIPDFETLQPEIAITLEILRNAPRKLDRLLSDLTSDRVRLRIEQVASPRDRRLRGDQVRLIAAALLLLTVAVLVAGTRGLLVFNVIPIQQVLWLLFGVGVCWLVVLWRRLP